MATRLLRFLLRQWRVLSGRRGFIVQEGDEKNFPLSRVETYFFTFNPSKILYSDRETASFICFFLIYTFEFQSCKAPGTKKIKCHMAHAPSNHGHGFSPSLKATPSVRPVDRRTPAEANNTTETRVKKNGTGSSRGSAGCIKDMKAPRILRGRYTGSISDLKINIDHDPNDTVDNLRATLKQEIKEYRQNKEAQLEERRKLASMAQSLGHVLNQNLQLQNARAEAINHGKNMKSWGIKFNGHSSESIDIFIRSIENYATHYKIDNKDLLVTCIPEIMYGQAREWYIKTITETPTWSSLCDTFRERYRPIDYHSRLLKDILLRSQGSKETFVDYIQLMTEMNNSLSDDYKFAEKPLIERQLGNNTFDTMDTLLKWGKTVESNYTRARNYQAPPCPSSMTEKLGANIGGEWKRHSPGVSITHGGGARVHRHGHLTFAVVAAAHAVWRIAASRAATPTQRFVETLAEIARHKSVHDRIYTAEKSRLQESDQ
ncbi:hypothetical protein B566_EDAN013453 [Ephemera danica]|nr:hypothetical protein B566_EDAN013453 [Ephemera danica]